MYTMDIPDSLPARRAAVLAFLRGELAAGRAPSLAEIASAFPLDDAALATLKADLEARFKARLNVTVSIDPELIGGVRIAVGDEVIDASVRGKLANMAAALKK